MAESGDETVYYVISDLHIGGDEQLEEVPFLEELLEFLERLETAAGDVELLINGDAFGLWELTEIEGLEKFDHLEATYPRLFEQFRATGEQIQITLVPGNHDHELAAYDEYVERFAAYNVDLVQDVSVTRSAGAHEIHVEHGSQHDPNNRIEDWGNPHATPVGYYFNTLVTSRAGRLSDRGRYNWLKDVQAVTPTERIPSWLISQYFYREMNPLFRWALLPFLLLFNVSAVVAVLAGLDLLGIWTVPIDAATTFLGQFGTAGTAVWFLLAVNVTVAGLLLLVGVPLYLLRRDLRKTIDRFGLFETQLTVDAAGPYEDAARELFADRPAVDVYCYGHTHRPRLTALDDGVVVNSGTWLKRFHRRDGVIGILPPVFYPTYQLGAVRIATNGEALTVDFEGIEKPTPGPTELTLSERLLTLGRTPDPELPDGVTIDPPNGD
jgi:UDP-2,3-diacylglucosamine pyrophosphatase LpxH